MSSLLLACQNNLVALLGAASADICALAHSNRWVNNSVRCSLELATNAPSLNKSKKQKNISVTIDTCSTCEDEKDVESCIHKYEYSGRELLCRECLELSFDFVPAVCSVCGAIGDIWLDENDNEGAVFCFHCVERMHF